MNRFLLVVALFGMACGEDGAREALAPDTPPSHAAPPQAEPAPATLGATEGEVTIAGALARSGDPIEAEKPIVVPHDGSAVLQLRDGGRVALDGGSLGRVVTEGAAQLLLIRGGAHIVQLPAGSSPRPPLRVVTPSATVEIAQSGEAYVVLFEGGASWVVALGGGVEVSTGESDARRRLRTVSLVAGQAVAVPDRIAEPTEAPRRLADARLAARALAVAPPPPEADALMREVQAEARRLDQALRALETETRRGRELTREHGDAVRESKRADVDRLQRALVDHSQLLYRLRQLATVRWERLRAKWLRLTLVGHPPVDGPVDQRRERVAGLLGF